MAWIIFLLGAVISFVVALLAPWMWLSAVAALFALLLLFGSAFALLARRVGGSARSELDALGPEDLRRLRERMERTAAVAPTRSPNGESL